MLEEIIIFGGGLHSICCLDINSANQLSYSVLGVIDSRQKDIRQICEKYKISKGVIAIGDNWSRKLAHDQIIKEMPYFKFVNLIHPSASISSTAGIGKGVVIMAGAVVNPEASVGDFSLITTKGVLEHNSIMESYSSIIGGMTGGKAYIGKYASINLGSTMVDRVSIGENSVLGAGAVLLKDLPDNVLAYGNPARMIRERKQGERFLK